jgi:hypothetical protein
MITLVCTAPITDFRLKLDTIRKVTESVELRHHESEFTRFINDLGYRESRNNWLCVNHIGCFGEWQFAESTLRYLGFSKVTLKKFRTDPSVFTRETQIGALKALIRVNLCYLKDYEKYIGTKVKGITVTRSGMIAASHLGGAGSLKKLLASGGKIDKSDSLGTRVSDYLKKFAAYEID